MVLELNASDERGIDVVVNKLKLLLQLKLSIKSSGNDLKLVILDEADAMTSAAQNAFVNEVMENYVHNVRFAIICNYVGQNHSTTSKSLHSFSIRSTSLGLFAEQNGFCNSKWRN